MRGVYYIGAVQTQDKELLTSLEEIKEGVSKVASQLGLNIVSENNHVFNGSGGITYCFILSQSHFVVHTWPEDSKVYFDIFSCNKIVSEQDCRDSLAASFKGKVVEFEQIQ